MWHIDTTVIRLLDGSRAYLARGDRQLLSPDLGVAGRPAGGAPSIDAAA
jgi:hypothetical protein